MRTLARYAVGIGAAALVAGCGALRQAQGDMPSIGAPGAIPQASALAARTTSSNYKVVYSFGATPDGRYPLGTLIDVGGKLYGTTDYGGANCYAASCGTVYKLSPTGQEKVLYRFANPPDGRNPLAGLIDVGGTLYGTAQYGGSNKCKHYTYGIYFLCGTVFSVTPSGTEKVLHNFGSGEDGIQPAAGLIEVNGTLYGTTEFGGAHRLGTVFSITPSGSEKVLHSFVTEAMAFIPPRP